MRILIYSTAFYPMIGGLENVVESLAGEFAALGHDVCVACQVEDMGGRLFPYRVVRRPSALALMRLVRWSEVVLHVNVNLRALFPFLLIHRPWIVSHQGPYWDFLHAMTWQARLKYFLSRFARNIACSAAVAAHHSASCVVVPNPYDDTIFKPMPEVPRTQDLIFVGRLVSDKGADMMVEAAARLHAQGIRPTLTIIGGGPEEMSLRKQVHEKGLDAHVIFTGPLRGAELAAMMNAHRIMVVPSKWDEPFGIVALEGIACGCVVVGSEGGGLKDAIGLCGLTFPNGDIAGLEQKLKAVLTGSTEVRAMLAARDEHLSRHTKRAVAAAYLHVIARAAAG